MSLIPLTLALLQDVDQVVYVRFERADNSHRVLLQREDLKGASLGAIELKREEMGSRMRATSWGTIVVCRPGKIVEIDREGKVLWKHELEPGSFVVDAHKSADGGALYASMAARRGKGFIAEVDAQGKELRRVSPEVDGIRSAWAVGRDRLLVASLTGVCEIDWEGKKHFERKVGKGEYCYDVEPLPGGNYLYVGSTPGQGKAGKVAEYDRDGKEIWSGAHGCPTSVQALANGNVLVGGG
jgi:hypothetical protein